MKHPEDTLPVIDHARPNYVSEIEGDVTFGYYEIAQGASPSFSSGKRKPRKKTPSPAAVSPPFETKIATPASMSHLLASGGMIRSQSVSPKLTPAPAIKITVTRPLQHSRASTRRASTSLSQAAMHAMSASSSPTMEAERAGKAHRKETRLAATARAAEVRMRQALPKMENAGSIQFELEKKMRTTAGEGIVTSPKRVPIGNPRVSFVEENHPSQMEQKVKDLGNSPLPPRYHVNEEIPIALDPRERMKTPVRGDVRYVPADYNASGIAFFSKHFPSNNPSSRSDAILLMNAFERMIHDVEEEEEDKDNDNSESNEDAQRTKNEALEDKVYRLVAGEMVRQVKFHCIERGTLLAHLFEFYQFQHVDFRGLRNYYSTRIDALESSNEKLQEENASLWSEVEQLRETKESMTKEIEVHSREMDEIQHAMLSANIVGGLYAEVQKAVTAGKQFQNVADKLSLQNGRLTKLVASLEDELNDARRQNKASSLAQPGSGTPDAPQLFSPQDDFSVQKLKETIALLANENRRLEKLSKKTTQDFQRTESTLSTSNLARRKASMQVMANLVSSFHTKQSTSKLGGIPPRSPSPHLIQSISPSQSRDQVRERVPLPATAGDHSIDGAYDSTSSIPVPLESSASATYSISQLNDSSSGLDSESGDDSDSEGCESGEYQVLDRKMSYRESMAELENRMEAMDNSRAEGGNIEVRIKDLTLRLDAIEEATKQARQHAENDERVINALKAQINSLERQSRHQSMAIQRGHPASTSSKWLITIADAAGAHSNAIETSQMEEEDETESEELESVKAMHHPIQRRGQQVENGESSRSAIDEPPYDFDPNLRIRHSDRQRARFLSLFKKGGSKRPIKPLSWILRITHQIYDDKCAADDMCVRNQNARTELPEFVIEWVERHYGLKTLSNNICWDIHNALKKYKKKHTAVKLFTMFLDEEYSLQQLSFFLGARSLVQSKMIKLGENEPDLASTKRFILVPKALDVHQRLFRKPATATKTECEARLERIAVAHSRDSRKVDCILFLKMLVEEYGEERRSFFSNMAERFRAADKNGDNLLTVEEFAAILKEVQPDISERQIQKTFYDAVRVYGGENGCLDIDAFVDFCYDQDFFSSELSSIVVHCSIALNESDMPKAEKLVREYLEKAQHILLPIVQAMDGLLNAGITNIFLNTLRSAEKDLSEDRVAQSLTSMVKAIFSVSAWQSEIQERYSSAVFALVTKDLEQEMARITSRHCFPYRLVRSSSQSEGLSSTLG